MTVDEREAFREALRVANVPSLLMVLHQLTGDEKWLADPYRPTRSRGLSDNDSGGLAPDLQDEVRAAALEAILEWRAGRPPAIPEPSRELLIRMMSWATAEPVSDNYAEMIAEGLGLGLGQDDAPEVPQVPPGFRVVVIGAGVSGLCAAVSLGRAGIPYTIIERNSGVGGTWLENRYPGCGVDTPSHLYSFSFAKNDWSRYFAGRDELHDYLERIATEFDIRPHIRFDTEVTEARYDADSQSWLLQVRGADGSVETVHANVVITAVGAFNKPKYPDIAGLETFPGPVVHTARWPSEGVDLAGRRVAVIGNGASAMQLVPAIAGEVASVTVFQRSPQWAAPFEKFLVPVPDPVRFLLREVPLYEAWYRLRQAWIFNDRIYDALHKDPEWPDPDRSINRINDGHREFFTRYIVSELGDRQDLLESVLPTYPPFGKRMLLDNGWFRTLRRDNVHLVTDRVARVDGDRIVTRDGNEHQVDVIVLATGFDVVRFLAPMTIRGRSGATLSETWNEDDPRAYLGCVVPDFPNLFCLYGPNTQTGHGGSVMFMMEVQTRYIMSVIAQMIERGLGAVECRADIHDRYNDEVDRAHEGMVWTHPGMDTYYRNSRGRVVVNNPFRVVEFWHMARQADLDEYQVEPARVRSS